MANDLLVRILGDTRGLERSFARANQSTVAFGRNIDSTGAKADKAAKQFAGFGRGVATGFGGAIAASVGIDLVKQLVSVAAESQQVLGQTRVALEATGKSWEEYGATIEATVKQQSRLGFDDENLLRTFQLFVRSTGDVNKALTLNNLAMDVARARYIDLDQAAQLVNKATLGQAGALRRLGIDTRGVTKPTELLALLTEKYGGAAEAAGDDAATSMARTQVAVENLQESIGTLLLPALELLAKNAEVAATFLTNLTDAASRLGKVEIPEIEIPFNITIGGESVGDLAGKAFSAAQFIGPFLPIKIANEIAEQFRRGTEEQTPNLAKEIQGALEDLVSDALALTKPVGFIDSGPLLAEQFKTGIDKAIDMAQALAAETIAQGKAKIAADKAADAAEATAEAIRKRNEKQARIREAQREALQRSQFRALGLSASGDEIVPGAENLQKRITAALTQIDSGQIKVSSKMEQRLRAALRLIKKAGGKLTEETRRVINDWLKTLNSADDQLAKGPLTRTSSLNANKILEGLGLTPEQEREARARLSSFNSAGQSLAGANRPTGNFQSQTVDVTVNNTTNLDGQTIAKSTTREQQKTKRRNAKQKRGPRSGI